MARQLITINVFEDDNTMTVETDGFQGKGCKAIHDAFAEGSKVLNEKPKPEYYKGNGNGNVLTNGQ